MSKKDDKYQVKVLIVGYSNIGKTCLAYCFTDNRFFNQTCQTIGIDFRTKYLSINNKIIHFYIWDSAGVEKYYPTTKLYYFNTKVFIITYDITNEDSFNHILRFLIDIRNASNDAIIMLVGLKSDLENYRRVSKEEALGFAIKENILFTEASSKDGTNVQEILNDLSIHYINKFSSEKIPEEFLLLKNCEELKIQIEKEKQIQREKEMQIQREKEMQIQREKEMQIQREKEKQIQLQKDLKKKFQNNDLSFVYKNKLFPFNLEAYNRFSNYFINKQTVFQNHTAVNLFEEYEFNTNISEDSIQTFIQYSKCVDENDFSNIKITIANVIDIFILSTKYKFESLNKISKRIISNQYKEIIGLLLINPQKYPSYIIEEIISHHLIETIEQFESLILKNLPISTIYRILSIYYQLESTKRNQQVDELIMKIILKEGIEIYEIFKELKVRYENPEFFQNLLMLSSNSSMNMKIFSEIFNEMKKEINELKEKINSTNFIINEQKQIIYSNITSVTIPSEIKEISKELFKDCRKMKDIHLPSNLVSIQDSAFENCTSLTSIWLPNTLRTVGKYAFRGCSSLTKIVFPSEIISIGEMALDGCLKLKEVTIPSTIDTKKLGIDAKTKIKII